MQNFLNVFGIFFSHNKKEQKLDYEEASVRKWGGGQNVPVMCKLCFSVILWSRPASYSCTLSCPLAKLYFMCEAVCVCLVIW